MSTTHSGVSDDISAYWFHRGAPRTQLAETIWILQHAGKRVAIVDDVPSSSFDPATCHYDRPCRTNKCTQNRSRYIERSRPAFDEIRRIVAENPRLRFISLVRYMYDKLNCYMAKHGLLFYRNRHHLSINGSRYLGRMLAENDWFRN
jgi:hypothetical protein